jgi:hypothetical protein
MTKDQLNQIRERLDAVMEIRCVAAERRIPITDIWQDAHDHYMTDIPALLDYVAVLEADMRSISCRSCGSYPYVEEIERKETVCN